MLQGKNARSTLMVSQQYQLMILNGTGDKFE